MSYETLETIRMNGIDSNSSAPPVAIPPGHVGEFVIPGTGRRVWWTGRVAIGLLHQPQPRRHFEACTQSALWIQKVLIGTSARVSAAHD